MFFLFSAAAVVAIDTLLLPDGDRTATNETSDSSTPLEVADVEWVVDGDTVDLLIDGQSERVRLIGIDTPESVSRTVPEQCFGAEATDALRGLLPVGTQVRIQRDVESRDRYDRLLLYLHRAEDGLFVNRWLIENGFADAVSYRPNTTYQADFAQAMHVAKADGVGLWSVCDGPDQPLS